MYQSIPKRVYTTKESAMPKLPPSATYSSEQKECNPLPKIPKEHGFLKKMETDDLLLIGLLLLLLSEDGDHQLLVAVVAFLLFF